MGTTTTGSSEDREEKRVPSYAKQFRQNFTITKSGKVKERSGISKLISSLPSVQVAGRIADELNYKRRLKFAKDKGINLLSESKEYVTSPDALRVLEAAGYVRQPNTGPKRPDDAGLNQSMLSEPSSAQADEVIYETGSDSAVEKARETEEERLLKIKRGKVTRTKFKQDDSKATLSKKILLGD
tara:strand:+ start:677 stop:1228 length:552 start_codon:yes stop_codon:yes gene_type:complete